MTRISEWRACFYHNVLRNTVYTSHFILLILLLLAFFLRIHALDSQSLRGDEAATVHYSAMPIAELWELARVTDPHPPLYYLLLHPWQAWLGESAWAMRFSGVIPNILTIAVLYALARRTLKSKLKPGLSYEAIALLATALMAISPFQIWLAQDLRSYPLFTLFGLLSSWALWKCLAPPVRHQAIDSTPTSRFSPLSSFLSPLPPWLLYVLLTVACLYTHYYTVFLLLFQGLFVLVNIKKFWPHKWVWLIAQVSIGLLILPGLYLAWGMAGQAAGGIEVISTTNILRLSATSLLTGLTIDPTRSLWASLLLTPVVLLGLALLLRRHFTAGTFWGLFFAAPVVSVIVLSIDRPFFKERFLVQAHPAFELLLAVGFWALWNVGRVSCVASYVRHKTYYVLRFIPISLFIALLYFNFAALINYFTNPTYAKAPPWHLYHDYVHSQARPGDLMLTNFPEAAISYYSPNELPFRTIPDERDLPTAARLRQIAATASQYQRIWFLPLLQQGFDEQGDVLNWLDRHADRVNQIFFPAYNLNLYLTPSTIDAMLIAQPVNFAHGLHLRGYQVFDKKGHPRPVTGPGLPVLTLKPGDELTLSLYWQADGPTDQPYTVFTHLIAADGFNQTSRDNQPVWGTYPTTAWLPGEQVTDKYILTLPQGIPPGDYRLRVGWYQAGTLARVRVLDDQGQPAADHVLLSLIVRVE